MKKVYCCSRSSCGQRLASDHISKILPACVRSILGSSITTTATATRTAKKQLRLRLARLIRLIPLPLLHDYNVKVTNFTVCGGLERRQFTYKWRFCRRRRRCCSISLLLTTYKRLLRGAKILPALGRRRRFNKRKLEQRRRRQRRERKITTQDGHHVSFYISLP